MQKENFLESAPRCNGVHLQGEELDPPETDLNANQRVVTGLPRTDFFGSTASLTKEKTRRVCEHMSESLCTCTLLDLTLLVCLERGRYMDARSHLHCVRAASSCVGAANAQCVRTEPQCLHNVSQ